MQTYISETAARTQGLVGKEKKEAKKELFTKKQQEGSQVINKENMDTVKSAISETAALTQGLVGKAKKEAKKDIFLQEPLATYRRTLKDIYVNTKDPELKQDLLHSACFEIFGYFNDPFYEFLELYNVLYDVTVPKITSMAGTLLQFFEKWFEKNPNSDRLYVQYLTIEIQERAIEEFTKHHSHHLLIGAKIYHVDENNILSIIKKQIICLIENMKFKDAMEMAAQFNFKDHFTFNEFLLPRVLQDDIPNVKLYCEDNLNLQRTLIKFLDQYVGMDQNTLLSTLKNLCEMKGNIPNKAEKITPKSLINHIKTLLTYYKLDENEYAPNFAWYTCERNLQYSVIRRFDSNFKDGEPAKYLDHTSYVSTVKGSLVKWDNKRRISFLKFLTRNRNPEEMEDGVYWALYYKIDREDIPKDLLHFMDKENTIVEKIHKELNNSNVEEQEDISNLTINGNPIILVNEWSKLKELIDSLPNEEIVGIDSEWKPQYMAKVDEIAVLQIAVPNCVYLVDYIKLEEDLTSEQWNEFFIALLHGNAIKLGFDFINDLRAMFHSSVTQKFKEFEFKNNNCICIKQLVENIIETDPEFIDLSVKADPAKASDSSLDICEKPIFFKLSTLCDKFLGIIMDKKQQCSNWANRPLTIDQINYAAMDAHILIQLYDEIKNRAIAKDLDFTAIVQGSYTNCPKKERTKAKRATKMKLDDMVWSEIVEKMNDKNLEKYGSGMRARDFKCIVDLMLLGLGKHLRRCGVDVYIPTSIQDLHMMANRDRSRLIISSGKSAEQLRLIFSSRMFIIHGASGLDPLQQLKYVLSKAKIILKKEDIFIRCKECNKVGFLYLPEPVIQALYQSTVVCQNIYHDEPFDTMGWKKKLSNVDPHLYNGYGCQVCPSDEWFHVNVHQGRIDILRNLVIHKTTDDWISTQIVHMPENSIVEGRLYYICSHCGKIYYDGHQQKNYITKVSDIISTDEVSTASPTISS